MKIAERWRSEYAVTGIYVVTTLDGWPSKVGFSEDVGSRLREMQSGNWHELVAYDFWIPFKFSEDFRKAENFNAVTISARALERHVHDQMRELGLSIRGEWFDVDADTASEIVRKVAKNEGFNLATLDILTKYNFNMGVDRQESMVMAQLLTTAKKGYQDCKIGRTKMNMSKSALDTESTL